MYGGRGRGRGRVIQIEGKLSPQPRQAHKSSTSPQKAPSSPFGSQSWRAPFPIAFGFPFQSRDLFLSIFIGDSLLRWISRVHEPCTLSASVLRASLLTIAELRSFPSLYPNMTSRDPLSESQTSGTFPSSDSENYDANHSNSQDSDEQPSSSSSPLILYSPPTFWSIIRGAAINLLLPFVNGLMLGFGELVAHEAAWRLGWGGTKVS